MVSKNLIWKVEALMDLMELFLAKSSSVVLYIGVNDLSLHGIEVIKIGAKCEKLIDVHVERVLLMDSGKGCVPVWTDY
jgi:hypothetical protein